MLNNIKISELKETLNLDDNSMFPIVFRNETRKISFETIRDLLTDLNTDYTEKSGNIVTIITNINTYCNIGVKSSELISGTPVTVTLMGKNFINEEALTLIEENTIIESTSFNIIPGQRYTFSTHSTTLDNSNIEWGLFYYDESDTLINDNIDGWYRNDDNYTTAPANAKTAKLQIHYLVDYTPVAITIDSIYNSQLELGIESSDYEEYITPANIGTAVGGSIINQQIAEGTCVIYSDDIANVILKVGYYTDTDIGSTLAQIITALNELDETKADKSEIPDVSQFVTKSVNDLVNYYLKTETYTKSEVNDLISSVSGLKMQIVQQLPTTDIDDSTIYLILSSKPGQKNIYTEYIYIANDWEVIGTTDIDLSDYVTQTMLNTALANFQEVFVSSLVPTNTGWKIWIDESTDTPQEIYDIVANLLGYYIKPNGGIPKSDLSSSIQDSLDLADSAVQDVSGKEDTTNKVTSIDENSTNTQYPSAKAVYDKLSTITFIENNAGAHNSIYRGKDITDLFYDGTLSQQIAAETFDDIFIGDYIIGQNSGTKYLVADINYRLHMGDTECTTPHVLMIPEKTMGTAKMNDSNTTSGAYVGSKMYTTYLAPFKTVIENDFGSGHILSHRNFLANTTTSNYESAEDWYDSTIELMNEKMVYGTDVFHNIQHGTNIPSNYVIDKSQLSIFKHRHDLIVAFNDSNARQHWWLRDVVSSANFASVYTYGFASSFNASNSSGVRRVFLIY